MARKSYFTQFIVYFLFGCLPCLNAQVLELNAPAEELPSQSELDSAQEELNLNELDVNRLLDFVSPDDESSVEKASHAENAETGPTDLAKEESVEAEELPARPVDTKTLPVQVRELAGEPVTRGPIHEAFAEPFAMMPEATQVIPQAPPEPVEEIPPARPPESSKNMEWISGYWAWDTQSKEYIWISGVWRKKPKDRLWLPGRWEAAEGGHQWVPGAWMPIDGETQNVKKEVLPLPPKSLEQGPVSPAPSEEHFWVPGVWQQNNAKYAWRTGYWSRSQKNWVWVPDHYTAVAGGCVFVPGYWDYTWERRGTLYAPCTFDMNVGERVCYRPTQVIDTNQWLTNLWIAPRTGHYHFGDYHGFSQFGYQPWYQYYGTNRSFYDPFYTYYRWQFPATYGVGMYGYLNSLHTYYGLHAAHRPRVSLYGYDTWNRRGRGYSSFGDVRSLARLAGIDLRSYSGNRRYDYLDRLYDHGRNRDSGYRQRYNNDYGYRRTLDNNRSSSRKPERRPSSYANGSRPYSDQRTGRSNRAEIGVPRSRNDDSGRNRDRAPSTRTLANPKVGTRSPYRRNGNPETTSRPQPVATPRSRSVSRPNTFSGNRLNQGPRQVTRSTPSQVERSQETRRPQSRRPQTNRPPVNRSQTTRPKSQARPQSRPQVTRPQTRSQTRPQRQPQVSRPQPTPNRAPARHVQTPARKPSGAGFSTSGMKNSRNKADVMRQRAAMQDRIKQRKGR